VSARETCAQLWQAEAIEDGRLAGDARATFERHAASCAACTGKRAELAALRAAASRLPTLESNPFERRRLRTELLARADAQVAAPRPRLARRWAFVAGGALVAALAMVLTWNLVPHAATRRLAFVPTYDMRPSASGAWRIVEAGATMRLAVGAGHFELQVDKLFPGQRFLVELPDGELEVKGTRFVIDADAQATRRVLVLEGRVVLRLHGQEERVLVGGEVWPAVVAEASRSDAARLAESAERADVDTDVASGGGGVALVPVPRAPARRRGASVTGVAGASAPKIAAGATDVAGGADAGAAKAVVVAEAPVLAAGAEFATAVDAFTGGDFGRAEQLLAAFEAHHPDDSRVEDTAFLRVVARARRGDPAGARRLAREYLLRYPDGFRRVEAAELAR
jgi:hypothetical protein